jgi:hypothetical protein
MRLQGSPEVQAYMEAYRRATTGTAPEPA